MRPRPLIFLYHKKMKHMGSTLMRSHQLASLVSPFLENLEVSVRPVPRKRLLQEFWAGQLPKSAVLFATKGVVRILHASSVEVLHRRGCLLLLDVVDMRREELPGPDLGGDCLISPSISGLVRLQNHVDTAWGMRPKPLVAPVLHNADVRLYGRTIRSHSGVRIVYWGAGKNTVRSPMLAKQVTYFEAADAKSFAATLEQVLDFNVHFAVRAADTEGRRIKPFTKGVNAAVLGAIVLADRAVPDAVELLGPDYPFLVDANTETASLEGIANLRASHGGPDWELARARCRDMAEKVSPVSLARQIKCIVRELQD